MNAEETDKHRAEVNEKIQAAGGEIQASLCQDSARGLAYPIRKESNGYFCESVFTLARTNVKELSDTLKHDSSIIRYMIEHREKKRPPEKARRTRKMPRPSIVAPSDGAPAPLQENSPDVRHSREVACKIRFDLPDFLWVGYTAGESERQLLAGIEHLLAGSR